MNINMKKKKIWLISSNGVETVLLSGWKAWITTKRMFQRIQKILNSCPRRLYCIRWLDKIRNEMQLERDREHPIEDQKSERIRHWFRHTLTLRLHSPVLRGSGLQRMMPLVKTQKKTNGITRYKPGPLKTAQCSIRVNKQT